MEKAVLKTLIYADIFDYPLKAWEVHKWLIEKKLNIKKVEELLKRLGNKKQVVYLNGFYFLPGRNGLIGKRLKRKSQSKKYLKNAKLAALIFRLVPWVKLIGVSGSLAMENAGAQDDIDLFIVTQKNRLWISRFVLLALADLMGKRREKGKSKELSSGKICINILLEEDQLEQFDKNIYLAHEVLQMKVLWEKDGVYSRFLDENFWAFQFLPNWTSSVKVGQESRVKSQESRIRIVDFFEEIAKRIQLKYMGRPKGKEKISETALYLHPENVGEKILNIYLEKSGSI